MHNGKRLSDSKRMPQDGDKSPRDDLTKSCHRAEDSIIPHHEDGPNIARTSSVQKGAHHQAGP